MENKQKKVEEKKEPEKKAYHPPQFVQYGNIAKLTHAFSGLTAGDALTMMMLMGWGFKIIYLFSFPFDAEVISSFAALAVFQIFEIQ